MEELYLVQGPYTVRCRHSRKEIGLSFTVRIRTPEECGKYSYHTFGLHNILRNIILQAPPRLHTGCPDFSQ